MRAVEGAEDRLGGRRNVELPDVLDAQRGEQQSLGIAQRERRAGRQLRGQVRRDVEGHRHRPERAVGEPHRVAHRFVVGSAHEAGERREGAVAEKLEVAELARGERPGGPGQGFAAELGGAVGGEEEVDERRSACIHSRLHEAWSLANEGEVLGRAAAEDDGWTASELVSMRYSSEIDGHRNGIRQWAA